MQRYYFDCMDNDDLYIDEEGTELSSIDLAQEEAGRALVDLAKDVIRIEVGSDRHFAIEVRDDYGPVLVARLSFYLHRVGGR